MKMRENRYSFIGLIRSKYVMSESNDKVKLVSIIFAQVLLSFLDLIGVIILGLVGTIAFNGIQGTSPGGLAASFLGFFQLKNLTFQEQVSILAGLAVSVLILKTILSVFFTRRTLLFFARRASLLSGRILKHIISQDFLFLAKNSSAENLHTVTVGANSLILGVLATGVTVISDVSLVFVLVIGLFLISPAATLLTVVMFSMMAFAMHKLLDERAQKMGQIDSNLQIKSNRQIQELFSSYRETLVQNSQGHLLKEIVKVRSELADTQAEMAFMPNVSKYIIESSVILFAFLLSAIQFVLQDANQAITALATFLAAGTRMAPALLRIQQATLKIRHHRGHSLETVQKIKEIDQIKLGGGVLEYEKANSEFCPQIEVRNVSLTYPGSPRPTLVDVSLNVSPGEMIAITGPSGAGKTSLVDLMLGVIHPSLGEVTISGVSPRNCFEIWPGNTAYVPQTIFITNGTVRENICLGLSEEEIDDSRIWSVLESVSLKDFVSTLPNQLNSLVGESGTSISGGQRQRLGIARALYSKPQILIMDEATSSLDAETEAKIAESISKLKGNLTLILIAHRLSTVKNADRVLYMNFGTIAGEGTFEGLIRENPSFRNQAELLGFKLA